MTEGNLGDISVLQRSGIVVAIPILSGLHSALSFPKIISGEFIAHSAKTLHFPARLSTSASSHHDRPWRPSSPILQNLIF
jgi:hypothetical protein